MTSLRKSSQCGSGGTVGEISKVVDSNPIVDNGPAMEEGIWGVLFSIHVIFIFLLALCRTFPEEVQLLMAD